MAAEEILLFRTDEIYCVPGDEGSLGQGSFGRVRLGFHEVHGTLAIKCAEVKGGRRDKKNLEKRIKDEIGKLQKANHANVVRVFGWAQWSGSIAIIMEFMPGGNLKEILLDDSVVLTPLVRLRILAETATGIAFIHNMQDDRRLVHRDIKPENVLMTEDIHAKIADFGGASLSTYTGSSTSIISGQSRESHFTELYAAPEVVENPTGKPDPKSDVYSFGMTILITLARALPLNSNNELNLYLKSVVEGHRPHLNKVDELIAKLKKKGGDSDAALVEFLKTVLQKCWKQHPSDRPCMIKVRDDLNEKLAQSSLSTILQEVADCVRSLENLELTIPIRSKSDVFLHHLLPPFFCNNPDSTQPHPDTDNITLSTDNGQEVPPVFSSKLSNALIENTGKIMLIGGSDCPQSIVTYDVSTKKWSSVMMTTSVLRRLASAVNFKQCIYVMGGSSDNGSAVHNTVESLNLNHSSPNWETNVASMKEKRYGFSSTLLNDRIYCAGGWNGERRVSSGEYYDPILNKWKSIKNMNAARSVYALVSVRGTLFAMGGLDVQGRRTNSVECFDPSRGEWKYVSSMKIARSAFCAVVLNSEIYAIGGCDNGVNDLTAVEKYNLDTDQWSDVAFMNEARWGGAACALNGFIYAFGGQKAHTIEVYDPKLNKWQMEAQGDRKRWHFSVMPV